MYEYTLSVIVRQLQQLSSPHASQLQLALSDLLYRDFYYRPLPDKGSFLPAHLFTGSPSGHDHWLWQGAGLHPARLSL